MFENYSFGDLLSNLYKKKWLNLIVFIALSIVISGSLILKTINQKKVIKEGVQYSTYFTYRIDAPKSDGVTTYNDKSGYSEFYTKLLEASLNGAYLFNDVDETILNKMAKELDSSTVALKNSNYDFWDKKVVVSYLSGNLGVSVKILTPSKLVNDEIEKKFDLVIEKYKNAYDNTKIKKLESNYSKELVSKENVNSGYSLKKLLLKVFIVEFILIAFIAMINFVIYIFNPTINRNGDYSKYDIDFIQEVSNEMDILTFLKYKLSKNKIDKIYIVSSNKKLISKLNIKNEDSIFIIENNDINNLINSENIVFLEEYGITRYSSFEKLLQLIRNLDKTVLGVISYKL